MDVSALRVERLTVSYDCEPVLKDVCVDVAPGSLVGIVGPNGAGKSTLIKAVVGAIERDSGDVRVMGLRDRHALRRITYVPQRGSVDWDFPVNVYDVVCQGTFASLGLFGRMRGEDRRRVAEALRKVGMEEFSKRQIGELSGGQQQRVFLARALAHDGDVFLMDEPFVGVDAATEAAIVEVLRELQARGRTVLVVHHDLSTVREYFDQVLLLNRTVIAYGDTDDVFDRERLQQTYQGKLTIFDDGDLAVMG